MNPTTGTPSKTVQGAPDEKKVIGKCDYCQEIIFEGEDEDEAHDILVGDECITLCDSCYEHQH